MEAGTSTAAGWLPVKDAPRNGKPVILWIEDPDAPPVFPITAGAWEVDDLAGVRCWRVFSSAQGTTVYFDEHVRGWMPMPPHGQVQAE